MKKNIFKAMRLVTFIAFVLYMLETIYISGMFTNFMLLVVLGVLSFIQLLFSVEEKSLSDIMLCISYILSAGTIVSILY